MIDGKVILHFATIFSIENQRCGEKMISDVNNRNTTTIYRTKEYIINFNFNLRNTSATNENI